MGIEISSMAGISSTPPTPTTGGSQRANSAAINEVKQIDRQVADRATAQVAENVNLAPTSTVQSTQGLPENTGQNLNVTA